MNSDIAVFVLNRDVDVEMCVFVGGSIAAGHFVCQIIADPKSDMATFQRCHMRAQRRAAHISHERHQSILCVSFLPSIWIISLPTSSLRALLSALSRSLLRTHAIFCID